MVQHLKTPLPPLDELRPGIAPGLTAIVHKMLAKSADERYQTPTELAEALLLILLLCHWGLLPQPLLYHWSTVKEPSAIVAGQPFPRVPAKYLKIAQYY